jgi:hypothetical protein
VELTTSKVSVCSLFPRRNKIALNSSGRCTYILPVLYYLAADTEVEVEVVVDDESLSDAATATTVTAAAAPTATAVVPTAVPEAAVVDAAAVPSVAAKAVEALRAMIIARAVFFIINPYYSGIKHRC